MAAVNPSDDCLRRQTLDLLRFPLAMVILLIHIWTISAPPIGNASVQFDNYPLFLAVNRFFDAFLRGQSVPIYFFISGYVFFYGVEMNRNVYIHKIKNRIKTLLIPYLIWNTVELLVKILPYIIHIPFLPRFLPDGTFSFSWHNLLDCYWHYSGNLLGMAPGGVGVPVNAPLWFIQDLMLIVLCIPLLYPLLKWGGKYTVLGIGLLWVCWIYSSVRVNTVYIRLLPDIFFFSWGACMSIHRQDMLVKFGRYFKISMWMYPILGILHVVASYCFPEACLWIKRLNIVAGLLFAYNLAAWLLQTGRCRLYPFLASSAFFIYVSHSLVVRKLLRVVLVWGQPLSEVRLFFVYISTTILSAGILVGIFYGLERLAPRLLNVVTGRK